MRSGFILRSRLLSVVGLLATLTLVGSSWDQADARAARKPGPQRAIHGPSYRPPYAAIVVDDKSGQVLHEASADEPRHPASLTKIMTLYLLFEQLDAGNLKLDTQLPVSAFAALRPPTKLGLKAGQTLAVEDAIKGLVTKSANDAAVVVSEAIGGSEEEFAKLMTAKAHALGMIGTTYVNASGLPAEEQITTARDQAILGHAIQHRFPDYYRYFATPSFRYRNIEMRNHNALLGNVKGVDGIKTGYTEASGYNLVTSTRRDERHIIAVVLGGTSNAARDARMRQLIEQHIMLASTKRTASMIVELNGDAAAPVAMAPAAVRSDAPNAVKSQDPEPAPVVARTEPVPLPIARPQLAVAKLVAQAPKRVASPKPQSRPAPQLASSKTTVGVPLGGQTSVPVH
jgi:D-alanyl-D-alanine carboxypeptidase